ncbi:hypothetical protein BDV19DRAFT_356031 [Aspergillus venezuelensis]
MGRSPGGLFGFHVPTHFANVPIDNGWSPSWIISWTIFWTQQMGGIFEQEMRSHEIDEELESLKRTYLDITVSIYLKPLESNGRSIQPCLVQSDLWPGNMKLRSSSEKLCMFDACAYWGHNEGMSSIQMPGLVAKTPFTLSANLAICRDLRYKLGAPCIDECFKRVPKPEPAVDFDKRNAA